MSCSSPFSYFAGLFVSPNTFTELRKAIDSLLSTSLFAKTEIAQKTLASTRAIDNIVSGKLVELDTQLDVIKNAQLELLSIIGNAKVELTQKTYDAVRTIENSANIKMTEIGGYDDILMQSFRDDIPTPLDGHLDKLPTFDGVKVVHGAFKPTFNGTDFIKGAISSDDGDITGFKSPGTMYTEMYKVNHKDVHAQINNTDYTDDDAFMNYYKEVKAKLN